MFKWGVAEELIASTMYHTLKTVEFLKRGRSQARQTDPIEPVRIAHVRADKLSEERIQPNSFRVCALIFMMSPYKNLTLSLWSRNG